jgi:hypothetical protein
MACEGCAERREKIIELFNKTKNWLANPRTGPAPFQQRPMPPVRTYPVTPNNVKKDQHKKDVTS